MRVAPWCQVSYTAYIESLINVNTTKNKTFSKESLYAPVRRSKRRKVLNDESPMCTRLEALEAILRRLRGMSVPVYFLTMRSESG